MFKSSKVKNILTNSNVMVYNISKQKRKGGQICLKQ